MHWFPKQVSKEATRFEYPAISRCVSSTRLCELLLSALVSWQCRPGQRQAPRPHVPDVAVIQKGTSTADHLFVQVGDSLHAIWVLPICSSKGLIIRSLDYLIKEHSPPDMREQAELLVANLNH